MMQPLEIAKSDAPLSILCLGAHSDDIEIGVGATLLHWSSKRDIHVHWCVLSGDNTRADEARASAEDFVKDTASHKIELASFRDGFFPYQGEEVKSWFEGLKSRINPDIIFTHRKNDAHQDHREVNALTWNSFRNHLIFEYEIPKWDGDLGQPDSYVAVPEKAMATKTELLMKHFGTQRGKDWFDPETFMGLARLRGMECRAPERYAEAFFTRKLVISV